MSERSYLVGRITRRGRTREQNEDHLGTPPEWIEPAMLESKGRLYVVADGMGGHLAGQEASRRAVSRVFHEYYADPSPDIPRSLERAIRMANAEIYQEAQNTPALKGMGTTITAAAVRGDDLYVANVGDSRAYLVRRGVAQQLTEDHSLVAEQVRQGTLTLEQARTHPHRNVITRSLGAKPSVQVDYYHHKLQPGDRVVLCTDGLSNVVDGPDLAGVVAGNPDPSTAAEELLNLADRRGRDDDAAVIVVGIPGLVARPATVPAPSRLPVLLVAGAGLAAVLLVLRAIVIPPPPRPTPTAMLTTPATTEVIAGVPTVALVASSTPIPETPTPTISLTPARSPAPSPSPTLLPAPTLVYPEKGAPLGGATITFRWQWLIRPLKDNEYFDVRVWKEGQPHYGISWEKNLWYEVSGLRGGRHYWSIAVIRQTGPNKETDWEPVSEESEVWWFDYSPPGPPPTPTATLPPLTPTAKKPPTIVPAPTTPAPSAPDGTLSPLTSQQSNPPPNLASLPQESGSIRAGIAVSVPLLLPPTQATFNAIKMTKGIPPADVAITKTVEPELVLPGEVLAHTIHYLNQGYADAEGVIVTDTLPLGLTNPITSSTPPIIEAQFSGNVYTWTVGTLAASSAGWITITANVAREIAAGTILTNTVWITTITPENNTDNNTGIVSSTVRQVAGVQISPSRAGRALPGTVITYTHIVTNTGNGPDDVDLRAASSQCWDVTLDKETLSLDAQSPATIAISIAVPMDALLGTIDYTVITVTSRYDVSKTASVTDTTTVVKERLLLPLVCKGYCFDYYEPNNYPGQAPEIRVGDKIWAGFCPDDLDDVYRLEIGEAAKYMIELSGIPAKSDYDLYLYDSHLNLKDYSNAGGEMKTESIDPELVAGTYYVRVYLFSRGPDETQSYYLSVRR